MVKISVNLQFEVYAVHHGRKHGVRNVPQAGSTETAVGLSALPTFRSVQDPSLCYGVAHIQNGFPRQLNLSLETLTDMPGGVSPG